MAIALRKAQDTSEPQFSMVTIDSDLLEVKDYGREAIRLSIRCAETQPRICGHVSERAVKELDHATEQDFNFCKLWSDLSFIDVRDIAFHSEGTRRMKAKAVAKHVKSYLTSMIGFGMYAVVFACPWDKTKCIKLGFGPGYEGLIEEDGWIGFAMYAFQHRKYNNLLPDVYALRCGEGWYMALMERYDTTVFDFFRKDVTDAYLPTDTATQDILSQLSVIIQYPNEMGDEAKDAIVRYSAQLEPCDLTDANFNRLRMDYNCPVMTDLHEDNLMISYSGRVIIIDPSAYDVTSRRVIETMATLGLINTQDY